MKRRMKMSKYILKRKTFTRYDETDNLKRMKDSDILAEEKKRANGSGFKSVLRDTAVGIGTGAAIGAVAGLLGKKPTMNRFKSKAKTGAILGGIIMGTAGIRKKNKEDEDRDFYNRRLEYAQRHARRREAIDWKANMTQRDGYSY
jgi:hypothetical protein